MSDAGGRVRWDQELSGTSRCYADEPFDKRIELIERRRVAEREDPR